MEDLICDVCHKKTQELHGFNYSRIKMCNKCYILHLESQCENLRSYILNSFSENDREKFLKECCKGKLFDDVLKTFKPAISNAELKQELAELKERYILPKFQLGQTIFTANKPNECIYELKIVSIHIERSEFCDRKFNSLVYRAERIKDGCIGGYSEDELFATEQEALEKLKEMKGNE